MVDIEQGIQTWRDRLGLTLSHTVDLDKVGFRQAFFSLEDGSYLNLLQNPNPNPPW